MLNTNIGRAQIEQAVGETIRGIILEKAAGHAPKSVELTNTSTLGNDLGLTSLDLAQLVASLEINLGADPFQELVPITSVRTVGDVCHAFERFFAGEQVESEDAALLESKRRAEARKRH